MPSAYSSETEHRFGPHGNQNPKNSKLWDVSICTISDEYALPVCQQFYLSTFFRFLIVLFISSQEDTVQVYGECMVDAVVDRWETAFVMAFIRNLLCQEPCFSIR